MRSLYAFLIISTALHGLIFFSFHMFGENTQSTENLGKRLTTQFEVKQGTKKSKEFLKKQPQLKTTNQKKEEATIAATKNIEPEAHSPHQALQKKQSESLASVKGLLGVNRPLTEAEKYKVYIYHKIYNNTDYPEAARKLKQEGLVIMKLDISKSGAFTASVLKECPFSRLNKAAQKTFDSIGRFKPFPKGFKQSEWNITIPINYEIR